MSHFSFALPSGSSEVSLPSTIASTTTTCIEGDIQWEYIQDSLTSWLGPVPQPTHPRVLPFEFLLPSQKEFYRHRPISKKLRPPACYMATTGILHNEAPTWMGVTLPKIKEDTNLTSTIVFAFEFHPFLIFSSQCLSLVHSVFVEQNRRLPVPVYAELPEPDFPGGGKFDIYLSDVTTVTQQHRLTQKMRCIIYSNISGYARMHLVG
jgi:hypothetical protein